MEKPSSMQTYEPKLTEWSLLELFSHNKEAMLKVKVLFASFASGEDACSVIAVLISHWLHCNPNLIPTRLQFESLIIQGSSEWRVLCSTETSYCGHFDIETVVNTGIRPLSICAHKSIMGIVGVEKFEPLKDLFSLDEMWETITKNLTTEPRVFIVGWDDHFFVLKLELHACYIFDSFGARLFRGCNKAYVLKFDESSVIFGSDQKTVLCAGKECCKEFMKKFFTNSVVMVLKKEYEKGCIQLPHLYEKLQVNMSYMCLNTISSSISSSSSDAPSRNESDIQLLP
ncbi:hypothetical protein CsatB_025619 [Cannabis sativa]